MDAPLLRQFVLRKLGDIAYEHLNSAKRRYFGSYGFFNSDKHQNEIAGVKAFYMVLKDNFGLSFDEEDIKNVRGGKGSFNETYIAPLLSSFVSESSSEFSTFNCGIKV